MRHLWHSLNDRELDEEWARHEAQHSASRLGEEGREDTASGEVGGRTASPSADPDSRSRSAAGSGSAGGGRQIGALTSSQAGTTPLRSEGQHSDGAESAVRLLSTAVDSLRATTEAQKTYLSSLATIDENRASRGTPMVGVDIKQSLPVLQDNDPEFDTHLMVFQNVIDCYQWTRGGVRPYDILTAYRKCLPVGSTRLRLYDTMLKEARKAQRLPGEAKAVFDEIVKRLKSAIRETPYSRKVRLKRE